MTMAIRTLITVLIRLETDQIYTASAKRFGATKALAPTPIQSHVETTGSSTDHGSNHGSFIFQRDAVHSGFADTGNNVRKCTGESQGT